ncbi:PKD domain-containing protein [Rhodoflexus caldus]|uniref:PKD domain-containing protein n=1 Tax=Rhodoflexus caldus TaxID=2891236 RepID=UPI00202A4CF9|nr:PKD domain-containing protein [Rhodoflexus caldus]
MKRLILYLLFLWYCGEGVARQLQTLSEASALFAQDRLIVKFKPSASFSFAQPLPPAVSAKLGIQSVRQIHPAANRMTFGNYEVAYLYEVHLKAGVSAEKALPLLQAEPQVAYAEPIPLHYETFGNESFTPNDPFFNEVLFPGRMYGYRLARVFEAWEISKGDTSTVIAIVDSGVRTDHPDLRRNFYYNNRERFGRPGIDDDRNGFVDDSLGVDFAENTNIYNNFHGTAVAGVAAAVPDNNTGFAGVGYNCRIMPLKVTRVGSLNPVGLYQAILYAAENGAKIINISIGQATTFLRWEQDIINYITHQKDVLVVAAAGNWSVAGGAEVSFYPAAYENVLAVAASDRQDRRASNGIFGNHVALMAPGVDIWSTFTGPDYTSSLSGSSFAAPFVAGAAGLIRSKFPRLKAVQVAALLRVTADDVYALPENAPFINKLGRGRLNVLRALQNEATAAAIVANRIECSARGVIGQVANDDTAQISAVFRNMLRPLVNARVTLTTSSRYARVLQGSFTIGQLSTLDSVSNRQQPFSVYIAPDTPPGEVIHFRLNYTDGDYSDWQMFAITTSTSPMTFNFNRISLSAAANGRIGMTDSQYLSGIGLRFDNRRILAEMGLMVGLSPTVVSNSVYISPGQRSSDFTPIKHPRILERGLQQTVAYASFTDAINNFNRLNINVEQTISGRINTPHQQYIIVHYDITNNSTARFDSLRVGIYADWDIDDLNNSAGWDAANGFGYVYKNGGLWAGIKSMSEVNGYYAIDKEAGVANQFNFADGFSIAEKFTSLSTGVVRAQAGMHRAEGADVAHVVTAIISRLEAGEKRRVSFVIAVGSSLNDLQNAVNQGALQVNPATARSQPPIMPDYLCGGDTVRFVPGNGSRFRFYTPDNLQTPIREGAYLPLTMGDEGKTFFVSGYDQPIESALVPYTVKIHSAVARFRSIDSLNIADSNKLYLFDESINAIAWHWEFGGGLPVQTVKNPMVQIQNPGDYRIRLTITDDKGCQAVFTKTVKVVRLAKGNRPQVPFILYACENSPLLIAPSTLNARNFNFYHDSLSARPAATGRSYLLTNNAVRKVLITSIDSALESLPAEVEISRIRLRANFDYAPRFDTVIYDRVTFTDRSVSDVPITRWEWDFGDGSPKVTDRSPSYMYNRQGVFTVKLVVTNAFGCKDSTERTFRVGRKAPVPTVRDVEVCKGDSVTIRPSGGSRFNFYLNLSDTRPVHTGAFYKLLADRNLQLWVTSVDSIVESDARQLQIVAIEAIADFEVPEVVGLGPDTPPTLFYDRSLGATEWLWEFGDGTSSTVQDPAHRYARTGEYRVRLSIKNRLGCVSSIEKRIRVVGQGAVPVVAERIFCPDETVIIAPSNGTKFRFYTTPPPTGQHVAEGASWNLGKLTAPQTIYITNADSVRESLPLTLTLRVSTLHARFSATGTGGIVLTAGDTVRLTAESNAAVSWIWNLGNGKAASGREVKTVYERAGTFNVTLTVRDEYNCEQTLTRAITVEGTVSLPQEPAIHEPKVVLFPNPAKTKTVVGFDLSKSQLVTVTLADHLGRIVWEGRVQTRNGSIEIPMQNLASGGYFVYVQCSELTRHIRLIKE